jgi:hypothetical protein
MEICEWKHEYKVHRLHATWIKPEVVATKKYTGYLHYRFITTWSRFLWSPCCSYMCFFEFLYGPANCLSVYDIVFPMFWTFLWWLNGSVSGPILHKHPAYFFVATTLGFIQVACSRVQPRKVTIEKKDEINEYKKKEIQKKGKDKKKSVFQCPPLIMEYLC